jgi:hypothetical protein
MSGFTEDDINAKAANKTQEGKAYVEQVNSVAQQASTSVLQVAQNFTACFLKNPITGFLKCPIEVVSSARDLATSYAATLSNIVKRGEAFLSDIVSSFRDVIGADLQNAGQKFKNIGDDLQKCIQTAAANNSSADAPNA